MGSVFCSQKFQAKPWSSRIASSQSSSIAKSLSYLLMAYYHKESPMFWIYYEQMGSLEELTKE